MSRRSGARSKDPLLFDLTPFDAHRDLRSKLLEGLDSATIHDLLQDHAAVAIKGGVAAAAFDGTDVPIENRIEWPGSKLLSQRHQITVQQFDASGAKGYLAAVNTISRTLSIDPLVASMLVKRGIQNSDEGYRYLHPSIEKELSLLPEFPEINGAAALIASALRGDKRILVVSDYDADGNCAAALFRRAMGTIGGQCCVIQPDRVLDGYGLTDSVLARVLALRPELVVTLDLGTSDRSQFAALRAAGVRTVCIDHHKPQKLRISEPDVMTNPRFSEALKGYHDLCATGLAWLVARELFKQFGGESADMQAALESLLPFVATGTVADVMDLKGLNRALVKRGSELMPLSTIPAFQVVSNYRSQAQVSGAFIGFHLGPILNASGRIHPGSQGRPGTEPVAEFLNTDSPHRARELLEQIVQTNRQRKELERAAVAGPARQAMLTLRKADRPIHCGMVLALENVHEGVVGLVAARVSEMMQCPTIVLTKDIHGNWKGSGRSIPGIDLTPILASLDTMGLLLRGGGHPAAIGVSVAPDKLDFFTREFELECQKALAAVLQPIPEVAAYPVRWMKEYRPDFVMKVSDFLRETPRLVRANSMIEPCGRGNEGMKVLLPNVRVVSEQRTEAGHLRLRIEDGPAPGVAWLEQERLHAVVFARSVAQRRFSELDLSRPLDLIVQPAFDRVSDFRGGINDLNVQVLYAQDSAFAKPTEETSSNHKSRPLIPEALTFSPQSTINVDAVPGLPVFRSRKQFYRHFSIDLLTPKVQFRKDQFNWIARQLAIEREQSTENILHRNLLYRANTAAGKTVIALMKAAQVLSADPAAKVLYLVPLVGLARQTVDEARAKMTLKPEEIISFTGDDFYTPGQREAALRGPARVVVATPQTLLPFLPDEGAPIEESLASPLAAYRHVTIDEVHFMHGDRVAEAPSSYAYRRIVEEVLRLQRSGRTLSLWAQSGTPAKDRDQCLKLAETLHARFEAVELQAGKKGWIALPFELDRETRTHLMHVRDAYTSCVREVFRLFERRTESYSPSLIQTQTYASFVSAFRELLALHDKLQDRRIPSRSAFLRLRAQADRALDGLLAACRDHQIDCEWGWGLKSRLHELDASAALFKKLCEGRSRCARAVVRQMISVLYPARGGSAEQRSHYKVRMLLRPELRSALQWLLTTPTMRSVAQEFEGVYGVAGSSAVDRNARRAPRPWSELLQSTQEQTTRRLPQHTATQHSPRQGSGRRRPGTSPALNALDQRLLVEFVESRDVDPREHALRDVLLGIDTEAKSMCFVDEIFWARVTAARMSARGLASGWYAGRSVGARAGVRENLEAFRNGSIRVICTTSAGETGLDIPAVSHVIRFSPMLSPIRNAQASGRAGRQKGFRGTYISLVLEDVDPEIDERLKFLIARARYKKMQRG